MRNPYFREWSHAAQPAGNPNVIVMRFGLNPAREAQAVARGTADWTADQIPASLLPRIAARFGDRLHSFSITETDFYRFNTRRPLFSDVRVRRAVNVALDRSRIARTYGGRIVATPTCQVLPPGLAGYKRYCPYTSRPRAGGAWIGPDLKRARALVAASGTRGRTVSLWGWTDDPTIGPSAVREVTRTLRILGYRVNMRLVPHSIFRQRGDRQRLRDDRHASGRLAGHGSQRLLRAVRDRATAASIDFLRSPNRHVDRYRAAPGRVSSPRCRGGMGSGRSRDGRPSRVATARQPASTGLRVGTSRATSSTTPTGTSSSINSRSADRQDDRSAQLAVR